MKIQNTKIRILRIQRPIDILYIDIYYLSRTISKNDTSILIKKNSRDHHSCLSEGHEIFFAKTNQNKMLSFLRYHR